MRTRRVTFARRLAVIAAGTALVAGTWTGTAMADGSTSDSTSPSSSTATPTTTSSSTTSETPAGANTPGQSSSSTGDQELTPNVVPDPFRIDNNEAPGTVRNEAKQLPVIPGLNTDTLSSTNSTACLQVVAAITPLTGGTRVSAKGNLAAIDCENNGYIPTGSVDDNPSGYVRRLATNDPRVVGLSLDLIVDDNTIACSQVLRFLSRLSGSDRQNGDRNDAVVYCRQHGFATSTGTNTDTGTGTGTNQQASGYVRSLAEQDPVIPNLDTTKLSSDNSAACQQVVDYVDTLSGTDRTQGLQNPATTYCLNQGFVPGGGTVSTDPGYVRGLAGQDPLIPGLDTTTLSSTNSVACQQVVNFVNHLSSTDRAQGLQNPATIYCVNRGYVPNNGTTTITDNNNGFNNRYRCYDGGRYRDGFYRGYRVGYQDGYYDGSGNFIPASSQLLTGSDTGTTTLDGTGSTVITSTLSDGFLSDDGTSDVFYGDNCPDRRSRDRTRTTTTDTPSTLTTPLTNNGTSGTGAGTPFTQMSTVPAGGLNTGDGSVGK